MEFLVEWVVCVIWDDWSLAFLYLYVFHIMAKRKVSKDVIYGFCVCVCTYNVQSKALSLKYFIQISLSVVESLGEDHILLNK